jgi:DNA-directed RNA polymerase specialized sigma24 family protein
MKQAMDVERDGGAAGDPPGDYTRFFQSATPHLVRLGYLLLGERAAAEDVAQDVLEGMHRLWPTLRGQSLLAYARTGVVDRARSAGRRRAVARRFSFLMAVPEAGAVEPEPDPWL